MDADDLGLYNLLNHFQDANNRSNLISIEYLNHFNHRNVRNKRRKKKHINPMVDYSSREFKKRFRFYKDEVEYIFNLIDGENTLEAMVRDTN